MIRGWSAKDGSYFTARREAAGQLARDAQQREHERKDVTGERDAECAACADDRDNLRRAHESAESVKFLRAA